MGECAYRLKALWPIKGIPKESKDIIENFLKDFEEALRYWETEESYSDEFLEKFEKKFPAFTKFVKSTGINNFNTECKLDLGENHEIYWESNTFSLNASQVWHFADWNPLANWIKSLGAKRVIWESEEFKEDPFDFYDWEEITKNILSKKELLPLLKGINIDFDELIEERLKNL